MKIELYIINDVPLIDVMSCSKLCSIDLRSSAPKNAEEVCYLFTIINYSPVDIVILVSFIFITLSKGNTRYRMPELLLSLRTNTQNDAVQFWQICWYHATKTHAEIISNAGITFSGYEKTARAERAAIPGYF